MSESEVLRVGGESGSRRVLHVAKGKPAEVTAEYRHLARIVDELSSSGGMERAHQHAVRAQVALEAVAVGSYNRGVEAAARLAARHAAASRDPTCQAGEEAILGLRIKVDAEEIAGMLLRRAEIIESPAPTEQDGLELATINARLAELPTGTYAAAEDLQRRHFAGSATAMLQEVAAAVVDLVGGGELPDDSDIAAAAERLLRCFTGAGETLSNGERDDRVACFIAGALYARDGEELLPVPVFGDDGGLRGFFADADRALAVILGEPTEAVDPYTAARGWPVSAPLAAGDGPGQPISGPAFSLGETIADSPPDVSHPIGGGPIVGRRFLHSTSKLHCTHGLQIDRPCLSCQKEAARG